MEREKIQTSRIARSGWYVDRDLSYKIRYLFNMSDCILAGERPLDALHPAWTILTPDRALSQGPTAHSLSMFFHKSIPHDFKRQTLFHELFEAEQMYVHDAKQPEAHERAVAATWEFAQETLTPDQFAQFGKWVAYLQ